MPPHVGEVLRDGEVPSPLRSNRRRRRAAPRRTISFASNSGVLVLVEHVAGYLRDASVHLAQHVLLRDQTRRIRETPAPSVIQAAARGDIPTGRPGKR